MIEVYFCAGHWINEGGKRTPDDEREWTFNNKVALAFESRMNEYEGVKLTRTDDRTGKTNVLLATRTTRAKNGKADYYFSFHQNAHKSVWGNHTGVETYYNPRSKTLAGVIQKALVKAYGLRDRGIKTANLHITRVNQENSIPAVLVEGGFMDSRIDIKKLRDNKVLENAGKFIADAFANFVKLKRKTSSGNTSSNSDNLYKVQIGAFKNKDNAEQLAFRAKARGFDHYIVNEDGLHKVQIGAYANKENAESQADRAKLAGFDVYIEGATVTTGRATPQTKTKVFKVGDKVKIKSSAKNYTRTPKTTAIPSRIKGKTYTIQQMGNSDVLLKEIVSWVKKTDLQ